MQLTFANEKNNCTGILYNVMRFCTQIKTVYHRSPKYGTIKAAQSKVANVELSDTTPQNFKRCRYGTNYFVQQIAPSHNKISTPTSLRHETTRYCT